MKPTEIDDDQLLDLIRESLEWKERDERRSIKYRQLYGRLQQRLLRRLIVASTFCALFATFGTIFLITYKPLKQQVNTDNLFARYFEPVRFSIGYRNSDHQQSLFEKAVSIYKEGNLAEAKTLSDSLMQLDSTDPDHQLLHASVLLSAGQTELAQRYFQNLLEAGGSFALHAQWYLALIDLKQGSAKACQDRLKQLIRRGDRYYVAKARSLMKDLPGR